jgi:hypothetical protein
VVGTFASAAWYNAMLVGFASGFLASGGDLRAGLLGAMGGALFAGTHFLADKYALGLFEHSLLKGLAGGVLSAAGGGGFQDGFLGAFAGGYLGEKFQGFGGATGTGGANGLIKRVVRDALIGGVASQLGGGKFKNGAATAAFARLFNDERLIGSQLSKEAHGSITHVNDDPRGADPNQPVDARLADAIETAVEDTGFDINVNSTTGGQHQTGGPHYDGRAADINRVNGRSVADPANRDAVRQLQESLASQPGVNQILGPALSGAVVNGQIQQYDLSRMQGAERLRFQRLIDAHRDHIHVGVSRR